jgi:hypothetical protein
MYSQAINSLIFKNLCQVKQERYRKEEFKTTQDISTKTQRSQVMILNFSK